MAVSCSIKRHFLFNVNLGWQPIQQIGKSAWLAVWCKCPEIRVLAEVRSKWTQTRGKKYRHLDSETKKNIKQCHQSSFYWATTITKYTTYYNPHCTAYAYSDVRLGFLTMIETLTVVSVVYNSLHADWTSTIIQDCASFHNIIYLSVYYRRPSEHLIRKTGLLDFAWLLPTECLWLQQSLSSAQPELVSKCQFCTCFTQNTNYPNITKYMATPTLQSWVFSPCARGCYWHDQFHNYGNGVHSVLAYIWKYNT